MGAYIYRVKGTKAFQTLTVDGKPEKVYDLIYWYKPYYHGSMFESEPKWMKPIHMLHARLDKKFKEIGYPKFVRYVTEDGKYDDYITEWGNNISCTDEGQWYQTRKRYNWNEQLNSFCSEKIEPVLC